MPHLSFAVVSAAPMRATAVPAIGFRVLVVESSQWPIHSIILRCQIRIEPAKRRYDAGDEERLLDLFGTRDRWSQTVRDLQWTQAVVAANAFTGETEIEVPAPCSFDFALAATKYFDALESGDIPLSFLFSGSVFYEDEGRLRVSQIPWDREAKFRLPVQVWKKLMAEHYANTAWLGLRQDVFDRLLAFKRRHGAATWDEALERLLAEKT